MKAAVALLVVLRIADCGLRVADCGLRIGLWTARPNESVTELLFGGVALGKPDYIALWSTLKPDSQVEEVVRNFFIRQPILWLD